VSGPSDVQDTSPAAPPPAKGGGMLRSSFIFGALTLVSRFLGFARDLAISARLGASQTLAADAYFTALAFPNLFRRVLAEGPLAAAFVPAYSRTLAGEGDARADQLAADTLATICAMTVAVTIAAQLAMPWLMIVINPGYVDEPEKFRLAVILTQIAMPYLPCVTIAALFSGVLNARNRFIVSGLYPTLLNVVMLLAVLPQHDPVKAAYAASVGVIIAGVTQAAMVWWGAHRAGARVRLRLPRITPEIKALAKVAIPTVLANSATQLNIFISGILASQVAGARSWMNYAERLYQLPLSLVGVAIGVALLPRLARALQIDDHADAQTSMDQALVFSLALSLPAAAALVAMPYYLIDGLFTRGEFVAHDARETAELLFHYGWGVPAFVLIQILQRAFFARQDTKTPMRVSLISVAVNIGAGIALFNLLGVKGVAIATSLASWLTVLQLTLALRGTYRPTPKAMSKMIRVAIASLALGGLLALASHYRPQIEAPLAGIGLAKELAIVLVSLVGGIAYPVLVMAFGGVTPAEVKAAFRRRR
jgi:putative peptidoglycan lipid II flippase